VLAGVRPDWLHFVEADGRRDEALAVSLHEAVDAGLQVLHHLLVKVALNLEVRCGTSFLPGHFSTTD